jgi:hypothetical protein
MLRTIHIALRASDLICLIFSEDFESFTTFPVLYNAANSGRLIVDCFARKWRSHAQNERRQGCPRSNATNAALPCVRPAWA